MPNVFGNNEAPTSPERVELFCIFVACSYTSMETTVLSCSFSWIWSDMPKVLQNNKSPISLEKVWWLCWFFAFSYLHVARYKIKLQKYAIFGWYCRLSDFLNLKNSKTIWDVTLIFYMVRQPLKLQNHFIQFWVILGSQILLVNQFAGFFTFDLIDLLILIPGIHCYVVLVWLMYLTSSANTLHQTLLHIHNRQRIDITSIFYIHIIQTKFFPRLHPTTMGDPRCLLEFLRIILQYLIQVLDHI